MIRLLYFSTVVSNMTPTMINELARKSCVANERCSITGALAFNGNHFAQVLEGDAEKIYLLMQAIRSDHRHTGVVQKMHKRVDDRAFEGWGMKLVGGLEFDLLVDSMRR